MGICYESEIYDKLLSYDKLCIENIQAYQGIMLFSSDSTMISDSRCVEGDHSELRCSLQHLIHISGESPGGGGDM